MKYKKMTISKGKEKSGEEKIMEGVAYWSKMCEDRGDFEAPADEADDDKEPMDVKLQMKTSKPLTRKTFTNRSSKFQSFKAEASRNMAKSNKDLPNKQEVDADQEIDNVTWADRWFQNSKVQKVVKDSKILSKVRTSIKVKLNTTKAVESAAEEAALSEPVAEVDKNVDVSLPSVIGSMEEYAKIVGKSVEAIQDQRVKPDLDGSASSNGEEEEEEEEDGLWGAIMAGTK